MMVIVNRLGISCVSGTVLEKTRTETPGRNPKPIQASWEQCKVLEKLAKSMVKIPLNLPNSNSNSVYMAMPCKLLCLHFFICKLGII